MEKAKYLAVWLAAALSTMSAPSAFAQAAPTIIPLSPYLGTIWSFEADIGGKRRTMLFDTAGGVSVITPELASDIGCELWGQLSGFRMRGDRVDLQRCEHVSFRSAGSTFDLPTIGVFDIGKLLPKDAPPVGGSIALDSFAGKTITIDLANRRLIVETPASSRRRVMSAREVRLRLAREVAGLGITPFVAVNSAKGQLWMELDTGSDAGITVDREGASALGLIDDATAVQPLQARLGRDVQLSTDRARVMPLVIDGNIGLAVLTQWVVTLDLARQRAWMTPASRVMK